MPLPSSPARPRPVPCSPHGEPLGAHRHLLSRFLRRDEGTMAVLSLFIFVAMLFVGGLAIDMIRYENERLRMQSTADRAVLAATMMREDDDVPAGTPEQILRAYFAADGLTDQLADNFTIEEDSENGRVVTVVPTGTVPSLFMRLVGVDSFGVATPSQAVEAFDAGPDLELVLVLDVSGSMNGQGKLEAMQAAASDLASTLLNDSDEIGDVAISFVPYDTWVLPPAGFLNHFTNVSGNGACNDWAVWGEIYDSTTLATSRRNCNSANVRNAVRPFVHDPVVAAAFIDDLRAAGTTSIDLGVRWGAMFFDPSIRPAISEMIANGQIHPAFEGRPYGWDEPNVVRAMILLTDGENCCGQRFSTLVQDQNAAAVCAALRERGVLVYTIAFQAPPRAAELMQACASSPSHFFNADADQIISVFQGITSSIQSQALRLTL